MNSAKPALRVTKSVWGLTTLAGVAFTLALLHPMTALAEGTPFTVEAVPGSDASADGQVGAIGRLKYQAVLDWLQKYLGDRFSQMEKQVTPEFAEHYILDYKLGRSQTNRALMVLSGHLDTDSLKRWIRVSESKSRGGGNASLKPYLILSSNVPGFTLNPSETAARAKFTVFGKEVIALAHTSLSKFGNKVGLVEGIAPSSNIPARTLSEIKALKEHGGSESFNCAVWVHLTPCASCGGLRLDTLVYNLPQMRQVIARSDDLSIPIGELGNADRVKAALKGPFQGLKSEIEEQISQGTVFSAAHRLVVEGLDSYRSYKQVENELGKLDYIARLTTKRVEPQVAEFESLTSLSVEELASRLQSGDLGGFRLRAVRVDPQGVVVRYSRGNG